MTETIRKERKNFLHTRILGKDLEVSAVGLGCMGMTYGYGTPADKRGGKTSGFAAAYGGAPVLHK